MGDTILTISVKDAQNLQPNVVALPGGGILLQLVAPGRGDVNLYYPSRMVAVEWWRRNGPVIKSAVLYQQGRIPGVTESEVLG